jgi:hypothetical protein
MTCIWDFVANLARAGKGHLEIKETMETVYGGKILKKMTIYTIIKKVKNRETTDDQRYLDGKKTPGPLALIASVAAAIEEDHQLSIKALATVHGTSVSMIHTVLHEDLGLEKKTARWVPKFLNEDQSNCVTRSAPSSSRQSTATLCHAGLHCHRGRDNGVFSHSSDEKAVPAVDKDG